MYIKVRKLGNSRTFQDAFINISKNDFIQEFRRLISEAHDVAPEEQLLLYKGKQLVDDHKIFDYGIQLNDVVQLMVRKAAIRENNNVDKQPTKPVLKKLVDADSKLYRKGNLIDVLHKENGAWYAGTIQRICRNDSEPEADLIFEITSEGFEPAIHVNAQLNEIRPRSYYTYKMDELQPGMTVMVNYNIDEPKQRGPWYDFEITTFKKILKGTLMVGVDKTPIQNCQIKFGNEVMRIEKAMEELPQEIPCRKYPIYCTKCRDDKDKKCRNCGCKICAGKNDLDTMILCDECDFAYHTACLNPPLEKVPDDDQWYCPECKTDDSAIVRAGEKLKASSKKEKMISSKSAGNWGKGMANVGCSKECTIVPRNHIGPIPGVEVGMQWLYRVQAAEAGVHRPPVSGIHGRENEGAFSLVLSGGYEDDVDNGYEFYYTGSGGRDLKTNNLRCGAQSCDQRLILMNKALALSCYAKFNDKVGAESKDWKKGRPLRVLRNHHLSKHSKYAPKEGNRYDGLYKVVKYYPEKGLSGFKVWKFLLRRDDPIKAPWEDGGNEFEMIYPPGYHEALEAKLKNKQSLKTKGKTPSRGTKRKANNNDTSMTKKPKVPHYTMEENIKQLIDQDQQNKPLWDECLAASKNGKKAFLDKIEELFLCVCCQDVVYEPATTECKHNVCKTCLRRSFESEIYTCPCCRFNLGADYILKLNEPLSDVLKQLFKGYEKGR